MISRSAITTDNPENLFANTKYTLTMGETPDPKNPNYLAIDHSAVTITITFSTLKNIKQYFKNSFDLHVQIKKDLVPFFSTPYFLEESRAFENTIKIIFNKIHTIFMSYGVALTTYEVIPLNSEDLRYINDRGNFPLPEIKEEKPIPTSQQGLFATPIITQGNNTAKTDELLQKINITV